jgi:hypothetical protein
MFRQTATQASEGIYYVVRYRTKWELVFDHFSGETDRNHYDWWQEAVTGMVAARWTKALHRSQASIKQDISLLSYAFPRGRVSNAGDTFLVLHGSNLTAKMKMPKTKIESAFGIQGHCRWLFDEHEQCQEDDKEQMRQVLGITEDWKAV